MPSTSPRIERGAALLDEHTSGWEELIDLDRLNLTRPCDCVVGQVYGDYARGLDVLLHDIGELPSRYGFVADPRESYDALTEKWRAFIRRRREQRAPA